MQKACLGVLDDGWRRLTDPPNRRVPILGQVCTLLVGLALAGFPNRRQALAQENSHDLSASQGQRHLAFLPELLGMASAPSGLGGADDQAQFW